MDNETQSKILHLLDVLAVEVAEGRRDAAAHRSETGELRREFSELKNEVRSGFERVERRIGRVEFRVEVIETDLRSFRTEFERRVAPLERQRGGVAAFVLVNCREKLLVAAMREDWLRHVVALSQVGKNAASISSFCTLSRSIRASLASSIGGDVKAYRASEPAEVGK